jgi:hypothetical protein
MSQKEIFQVSKSQAAKVLLQKIIKIFNYFAKRNSDLPS